MKKTADLVEISSDEKQVEKVIDDWAEAVRQCNLDGILANHTSDILMYDVIAPFQNAGLEEYRRAWEVFFQYSAGGPRSFNLKDLKVTADRTVAFTTATLHVFELKVRLTLGLRKESEQWLIAHEHHSALDEVKS